MSDYFTTKSIPFSFSLPSAHLVREEMTDAEFDAMMERGLNEARADNSLPAAEVFEALRRRICE